MCVGKRLDLEKRKRAGSAFLDSLRESWQVPILEGPVALATLNLAYSLAWNPPAGALLVAPAISSYKIP